MEKELEIKLKIYRKNINLDIINIMKYFKYIPVVPHKAVAEVSKIGNL